MLYSSRPERAEAPSPGQHPGYNGSQQDALKGQKPFFRGKMKFFEKKVKKDAEKFGGMKKKHYLCTRF
jgi:hypothetical protein